MAVFVVANLLFKLRCFFFVLLLAASVHCMCLRGANHFAAPITNAMLLVLLLLLLEASTVAAAIATFDFDTATKEVPKGRWGRSSGRLRPQQRRNSPAVAVEEAAAGVFNVKRR